MAVRRRLKRLKTAAGGFAAKRAMAKIAEGVPFYKNKIPKELLDKIMGSGMVGIRGAKGGAAGYYEYMPGDNLIWRVEFTEGKPKVMHFDPETGRRTGSSSHGKTPKTKRI